MEDLTRDAAYPVNKPKGAAQALARTGKSIRDAQSMNTHLGKRVAEGGGGHEESSALGTEDGPSAGQISRAVESGEKAMHTLQKAQENFEQAQQEVMQAQTDLEMLMQEAPLPVVPVPQVNVRLVKTLEALTRDHRTSVEP